MPHRPAARARTGLGSGYYWVQISAGVWEPALFTEGLFFLPACNIGFSKVLVCGAALHPPGKFVTPRHKDDDVPAPKPGDIVRLKKPTDRTKGTRA